MKRLLTIMAAFIMLAAGASAQTRALVTLSHEGQLTFFDNVSALEDAVEAAADGDIIYLSEGKFGATKQEFDIRDKKISIIGCGYKSHILPDIRYILDSSIEDRKLSAPLFDGVRLGKLSFPNVASDIDNVEIKKCLIDNLSVTRANNIIIDRCNISVFDGSNRKNIQFYNSKISMFSAHHCEIVENCNIGLINYLSPAYIHSSIIQSFDTSYGGKYENCLIGDITGQATASPKNVFTNCYDLTETENKDVLDDNLESTIEDMSQYLGTDGTVVGIYGGQWFPFSETPSVPTVDSANSSVDYDKETNQLNVTITVAPN